MDKRTTCLLCRLMSSHQVDQVVLKNMMKIIGYTEVEITEVFKNRPAGNKVYVLHGYWNTLDFDGVKIVKASYELASIEKALEKIVESNAAWYVHLTDGNWEGIGGERFYEIVNENGEYAKFYITEEVVDYEE